MNKKELKKFGITGALFFAAIATIQVIAGKEWYPWFYAVAALFFSGLLFPPILKPLYRILTTFGAIMGWIITHIILIALYFAVLTPIGLVGRLLGKHFLIKSIHPSKSSYWISVEKTPSKTDFERQF